IEGPYELLGDTQVRSAPGRENQVVAEVKKGMKIDVIGEEKGWLRVQSKSGNPPGYVEKSMAKPLPGN
ncbi:MAG: SH3 domain-containing protein, partial [Candidatus Binatia bacterium]